MLRLNKILIMVLISFFVLLHGYSFQFGNGNDESTMIFIQVEDNVKDVYLGYWNSYIIKNDDSLWGTGLEIYKDFGIDGPRIEKTFVKLQDDVIFYNGRFLIKNDGTTYLTYQGIKIFDYKIKKASFGALFIGEDNNLYAKGENSHGAFGTGIKYEMLEKPQIIMNDVIDVFYTGYSTQVINSKHELFVTGLTYLPAPYKTETSSFYKIADNVRYSTQSFYITDKNELFVFGWCGMGVSGLGDLGNKSRIKPTKVMDDVSYVESNQQVTIIIKTNGDLYGWGGDTPNYIGELGFGNKDPVFIPKLIMHDVKKVSLGYCQVAVIKEDGTLWMCGANKFEGGL